MTSELATLIPGHIAGCQRYLAERAMNAMQREAALMANPLMAHWQEERKRRRRQILDFLADGKGHRISEISAAILACSDTTRTHIKTMYRDGLVDFYGSNPRMWFAIKKQSGRIS